MKKILIIEDDFSYASLLEKMFSEEKYEVFVAKNGEEGLKLSDEKKPDIILLDIRMPVMDGREMLKRLREKEFGADVKVIFLTNLEADSEVLEQTLNDKNTFYILKSDVGFSELKQKVASLI